MTVVEAAQIYVERKQSLGLSYATSKRYLLTFSRQVGDIPLPQVTALQVLLFLNGHRTSTVTWRHKYRLLEKFFEFWEARGELLALPLPPIRPACPQTFVPYLYSRTELRLLLRGTRFSQKQQQCKIAARTLRTLVLFLYGTGAMTGEALRLRQEDVDLKRDMVTIRGGRFNRVRRIPIGRDLHKILRRYVVSGSRKKNPDENFFANKDGSAIVSRVLDYSFQRLRKVSGISRVDGACYQPRLHDLRHTFAVHRVTSCFKQGAVSLAKILCVPLGLIPLAVHTCKYINWGLVDRGYTPTGG